MKHTYTCPCGYKNSNKTHIHRHCSSTSCQYTVDDIKKIPDTIPTPSTPSHDIVTAPARFSRIIYSDMKSENISEYIHTFLQYCEKSKKKVENCVGMLIHRVYMGDEKIRFIVLEDFINKHKIYKRMYPMISLYRDQQLTKDRIIKSFESI